ncbi:diguanylate cyclase [Pandoraea capi]|uniref:Diguanylate cyclase n=1 Tax=Pandoraea capi TaxID=2508286 RepID=A0ABY6VRX8_9BURK|nr:diguanylate cyclase [Pandoraea capi]
MGGDEFGMILCGIHSRADAVAHSERLAQEVGAPFEFEGKTLELGVSVGIAMLPDDGTDMIELMDHADEAMYAVKRTRPGVRR